MANIYKRGSSWCIRYQHRGKDYRESAGPCKRDAEKALAKRMTEIAENRFLDKKVECDLTFDEFKPQFLEWSRAHKRSWRRDERLVKNLSAFFGSMNLEEITSEQVERFKRNRLNGSLAFGTHKQIAGPSTVNRELACLRRMLNMAVDLNVMAENHLAGKIKLLREPEGRCRYLEPGEVKLLLSKCADHLRPIVHMGLLTGMRRGELLGLTWSEVNLARGIIRLPGARTKNNRPRTIPLSGEARGLLVKALATKRDGCPLVFHRRGEHLGNIRKAFENACRRAGIKDFHFHDLRHSFASALAMAGAPLQGIGEILGHRTLGMTARYAHLSPQVLMSAAEKASAYLADVADEDEEQTPAGEVVDLHAHRAQQAEVANG